MTGASIIKGRIRRACPKCQSATGLRTLYRTLGQGIQRHTERWVTCLDCEYEAPAQKMDRKVYTQFAPEDADAVRTIISAFTQAINASMQGQDTDLRYYLTEGQRRIHNMPKGLRKKLEI